MSADNGIYILETEGPEYRVAHLQAAENLTWERNKNEVTTDPDVHIRNARKMWAGMKVLTNKTKALELAAEMEEDIDILEYGISFVRIPRKF